ncbi:thiol:disulfide interchange protein [Nautilia profundicola AmH]|uniref:Thiol:disulfide interchange protein n=1 Tax=Nautilia profundicola (strain ATCC BAA-1463 / DSM 18972 / AmH) TaxID=598659 RepID=B9L787_NAUPA|nr:thioredoxin fold domain-containing protein [Nautilia profundicola]ACM93487.1 thiol:disulfide interchange protein [Nautilia profundicola AmH]
MKKLLLGLGIAVSLFASDKLLSQKELNNVLKSSIIYPKLSQDIKKGIVKVRGVEKDGFYIINIKTPRGSGNIYITKDKKYTILGNVLNNKNGTPLTANFPVNKKIVQNGVIFTFGKGDKEIYLVTDPECPYCRMMEVKTKANLEKNYKVHVILFPLSFHKNAKAMSYYILAGKTDAEKAKRFREVLGGSNEWKNYHPTKEEKVKFDKILNNSKKAVEELGARGTPTVYDKDFNKINWTTLGEKK